MGVNMKFLKGNNKKYLYEKYKYCSRHHCQQSLFFFTMKLVGSEPYRF